MKHPINTVNAPAPTWTTPNELLVEIDRIRAKVGHEGDSILAHWKAHITDKAFIPSARNLAHYLALRQMDLGALQTALTAHGLSSLGRSESHVMDTLDTLHAALSRIAGTGTPPFPVPQRFAAGHETIARMQRLLFGLNPDGPQTSIMVTLPSDAAEDDGALARQLVQAGMTCARINCAHDDAEHWRAMADHVRAAAAAGGRECRILMDIGGPKCRIETLHAADRIRLFRGDRIVMVHAMHDARATDAVIVTISFPQILKHLAEGAEVWINDGHIGTRVVEHEAGRVVLEVFSARAKGERLRVEKGLNFPGTELDLDPLTEKDLADLEVVATQADLVGFSFVQRPRDIRQLQHELAKRRPGLPPLPMMLKIETPHAVANLPRLIVQAAGQGPVAVMIARGDLAVELGFARMSEIQEEIMWLCEAAHVPVVWATQVLDGLVSDGMPTRAETTDAAMSQRAECVMLNKGPYVVEAVRFLSDVLHRMDRHQDKKSARFGALHSWPRDELGL